MNKIIVLIALIALLSGCSETVDDVNDKAVARWQALIDNDYEKAYQYIAPSYRELEDLMTYQMRIQRAQQNIQWNDATFLGKDCTDEGCEVELNINYTYKFTRRVFGEATAGTKVEENWIKDGGTWYYLPKKSIKL